MRESISRQAGGMPQGKRAIEVLAPLGTPSSTSPTRQGTTAAGGVAGRRAGFPKAGCECARS